MANWASVAYAIEGPEKTLEKIEQAILQHEVKENSSDTWEGNVLYALGAKWTEREHGVGDYMRGFIYDEPWWFNDTTLRFSAEEAWGLTDFAEVLMRNFDDINVFWVVEEPGMVIYETNDAEGKYFPDRFYADTCINGNYEADYFIKESSAYEWLSKLTDGKVKSEEDVDKFNDTCSEDDFIYVHEFKVVT